MIFVKDKCTICTHKDICKYRELYNKCCDRISECINDLKDQGDEICNIDILCKHYIFSKMKGEKNEHCY